MKPRTADRTRTAILITYDREDVMEEARALCEAAGYRVKHTMTQKFLGRPKYGISGEAVNGLEEMAEKVRPDVIVYDEILKPSQNYNLAARLHMDILDREMLILEIFEGRASSAESKLQVRLAKMRYEMSRAREKVRLARTGEQPGFMGIGKFEVDVYYNDIRSRMHTARSKLAKAGRQRELHRQGRRRAGFRTISLAGYTSAGKTTLFNRLTGESKEQGAELFTTLSTTTRRVAMGGEAHLVSDTVGFISKLPAYMIEAFKSTLEELLYADVILLVIDSSDPPADLEKKFRSCMKTLSELGVSFDRVVLVLNKADLVDAGEIEQKTGHLGLAGDKKCIAVSAISGYNMDALAVLVQGLIRIQGRPGVKPGARHGN